jgi:P27 family predicted phage terminase small subunit
MAQRGRKSAASLAILPLTGPQPEPIRPSPAPDHLSPAMRDWWNLLTAGHDLDPHRLRLLEACCGAWDRMVEAREAVDQHGLTYESKDGDPRPRPEVAIERDARIAFARIVRELGLDPPSEKPGRYGGLGWIP